MDDLALQPVESAMQAVNTLGDLRPVRGSLMARFRVWIDCLLDQLIHTYYILLSYI
jgi:hypothetical protein